MAQIGPKPLTIYYFPTSFSSQKVLFALYEKDVNFERKLVNLFSGQHNEPWYVRLNPDGAHIPVLKHDDKIITEPSATVNYIDKLIGTGPILVPDGNSELGRNVAEFRKKLDGIAVDVLTYGIILHPHLSPSGCHISGAVQTSMKENFARRLQLLTELVTKHPDLRDAYLAKSQLAAQKYDIINDEAQVKCHMDDLEKTFKEVEQQLKKIKEASRDIADETWLFGPMFTAADISLAVLLNRLTLLGLDSHYFSQDKYPFIHAYHQQVQTRPAFQVIQKEISNLQLSLIWENLKAASPYIATVTGIGVAAGLGFIIYKYLKR
ncbi:hypothetical protein CHS0354_014779 [Potamilus streckersoni]|uniref:Ganglioside-induced differentiation-associated protein 1 n=1 Tax=Potamilus streckersoni TaxID=2493646 RepID=A0AAE0S840_9BIVA|nr:hypothetical protein CHS0354_014779 [Potamilus streckersoni]